MKLFKINIQSITILPFGSLINTEINYNINSNFLLLVSIAGIIMQLFLFIIFYYLFNFNFINYLSYRIFKTYNQLIILFNILPIIPLDGSKILLSTLERFIPYKKTLIITNIISIIAILLFIIFNKINLNLILISGFLFLKTYQEILEHNYIFNKFLLERHLHKPSYSKIKNIKSIKDIFKNKYNFINYEAEDKILSKLFDINHYFWYYLLVCN